MLRLQVALEVGHGHAAAGGREVGLVHAGGVGLKLQLLLQGLEGQGHAAGLPGAGGELFFPLRRLPLQFLQPLPHGGGGLPGQPEPVGPQGLQGLRLALGAGGDHGALHRGLGPLQPHGPDALVQPVVLRRRDLIEGQVHAVGGAALQGGGVHLAPGRQPRQLRLQRRLLTPAVLLGLVHGRHVRRHGQGLRRRHGLGGGALLGLAQAVDAALQGLHLLAQGFDLRPGALGDFNVHQAQAPQLLQGRGFLAAQQDQRHLCHGYDHRDATCPSGAAPRAAILRLAILERTTALTC